MQSSLERLRRRREELEGEGGFTLIELLIVIVILGILAAIVVFAVQNLSSSSVAASCRTDYKSVESGLEAYKAQMGAYPTGGTTAQTATGTTVSSASVTDTDVKSAPTNYTGTAGTGGVYPGADLSGNVNAAAMPTSSTAAADIPPGSTTYGGELLRGSNTAANATALDSNGQHTANLDSPSGTAGTSTGAVGPWLKDAPINNGHYTIFVANDGTGTIAVLGSDGKTVVQDKSSGNTTTNGWTNDINACSAVS